MSDMYILVENVCGYESILCLAPNVAICKREAEEHRAVKPYIDEHVPMKWYEGTLTKSYDYYTDHDYYHIYKCPVIEV